MKKEKNRISSRIKYSFDNFMSKGGFSVFFALMLLFAGAIVFTSLLRFISNLVVPDEDPDMANVFYQWWLSFLQISDGGAVAEDTGHNILNRIVGIVTLFLGMILFSSLVAFITSQFETMIENLKKGRSDVIEKNHTVILGFGDRVLEIIRELIVANESEKSPAVVVLSALEKDAMDDFFRDRIEALKTTRIVTRSGSTSSIQVLKKIGIQHAKSVIILNEVDSTSPEKEKALADAKVLKTILAVISCVGKEALPPIVAEIHLSSKKKLACEVSEKISIVHEHSVLAKLIVQTSRISGLAQVYDNLVGFEDCEFYFFKPERGWGDILFSDAVFHFETCSVLGIRSEDGRLALNPKKNIKLKDSDDLVLIAEDDSTIKFSKNKLEINELKAAPAKPRKNLIEKQLIVGWNNKAPIILEEFTNYMVPESVVDLVVEGATDEIKRTFAGIRSKYKSVKMRMLRADFDNNRDLEKLKPENYDNIIILSGEGNESELIDSETISKLLSIRHYFQKLNRDDIKTQLITEVADSENTQIIQEAGVNDFLISNRFISKIYAQVSEAPAVLAIYDDLFNEDGSEVYLKPLSLYMSEFPEQITFGQLCAVAMARDETCFGVRILNEEKNVDKGYGIYINPDKSAVFTLAPGDCLITLAEDDT